MIFKSKCIIIKLLTALNLSTKIDDYNACTLLNYLSGDDRLLPPCEFVRTNAVIEGVSNPQKIFVDMMDAEEALRYKKYWKQGAGSIQKFKENGEDVFKVMQGKDINTRQRLYTVPGEGSIKDVKINGKTEETYLRETKFDKCGRIGNDDYTDHGRPDISSHTNPYNEPAQHGDGVPGLHPDTP